MAEPIPVSWRGRRSENVTDWPYLLACLAVPAVWGYVVAGVYDRIAARRKPRKSDEDNAEMYYI
jgi:hypothetical protein